MALGQSQRYARPAWPLVLVATSLAGPVGGCATPSKRIREIDPVDKAMAAEESRAESARRATWADRLPLPLRLHVVARSRNVPIAVRPRLANGVGFAAGSSLAVPQGVDLIDAGAPPKAERVIPPTTRAEYCWARVTKVASGAIFAAGSRCAGKGLAVERWAKGEARGIVDVLPGIDWDQQADAQVTEMHARTADDVYVAATVTTRAGVAQPYLAHFDGEAWKAPPVPLGKPRIASISATPSGDIFLTQRSGRELASSASRDSELWNRAPSGEWRRVDMPFPAGLNVRSEHVFRAGTGAYEEISRGTPPSYEPIDVWAVDKDDVWVVALWEDGDDDHWVVLHTQPSTRVLTLGESAPRPAAPLASCKGTYFVALGAVPPGAAPNFDFLEARAALTGHLDVEGVVLLETVASGARVHGVFSRDARVATTVAARLSKGSRKAVPPSVTCAAPRATRVVLFDIATGDLVDE